MFGAILRIIVTPITVHFLLDFNLNDTYFLHFALAINSHGNCNSAISARLNADAITIQIRTRPHSMRDRRSNSINSKSCYVHAEKHGDHHHNGHNLSFHDHSPYLFIELSRSSL